MIFSKQYHAVIDSTQAHALEFIDAGQAYDGLVIYSYHQYAGRGAEDNTWETEPDKNLTCSIILKDPPVTASRQFLLNQVVSLAARQLVSKYIEPSSVLIKWPNDLYVENRKIGGVLLNHRIMGSHIGWTVLGLGLNVNQESFPLHLPNPVSMVQITRMAYDLEALLDEFLDYFSIWMHTLLTRSTDYITDAYHAHLLGYAETMDFIYQGRPLTAVVSGVNDVGQLVLNPGTGEMLLCNPKELIYLFPDQA